MILIILTISTIIWLLYWIPTYLILRHNYKSYKETYNALKNKDYLLLTSSNGMFIFRTSDKINNPPVYFATLPIDEEIIYFEGNKSIKLIKGYIHNNFMTWFDPYTNYWYRKIKEQIIVNSSVGNLRDYKLKQLNI